MPSRSPTALARTLATLRSFWRDAWVSRVHFTDWLRSWAAQSSAKSRQGAGLAIESLERRQSPDDPFGILQTAWLGAAGTLLTPGIALLRGWAGGRGLDPDRQVNAPHPARAVDVALAAPPDFGATAVVDAGVWAKAGAGGTTAAPAPTATPGAESDTAGDAADSDWLDAVGSFLDRSGHPSGGGAGGGGGGGSADSSSSPNDPGAPLATGGTMAPLGTGAAADGGSTSGGITGGAATSPAAPTAATAAVAPVAAAPLPTNLGMAAAFTGDTPAAAGLPTNLGMPAGFFGGTGPGAAATAATAPTVPATAANAPPTPANPVAAGPEAVALETDYAKAPLAFEPNLGQTDPSVRYLSHGPGLGLFLTDTSAVLALPPVTPATNGQPADVENVLGLQFAGANPHPQITASDDLLSRSNYFTAGQAITNVPQFGQVTYHDLYPGIDLVFQQAATSRLLEFDFVVAPGADPSQIQLVWQGASAVAADAQGNLVVQTGGQQLVETAPVLYQTDGTTTQNISGQQVLTEGNQVRFQPGAYDPTKPLVIDPTLGYSSYLGGSGNDKAYGIAVDANGDVYLAGSTQSTNFPTTLNVYQTTNPTFSPSSAHAAFVTKLGSNGSIVYSTYLGDPADTVAYGIAVDNAGSAYVVGQTTGSGFPVTSGAYLASAPSGSGFVTKLNATGSSLDYSTLLGDNNTSTTAIAVDPFGFAYVTGSTSSTAFPTSSGAYQSSLHGTSGGGGGGGGIVIGGGGGITGTNAFVTKLNPNGGGLVYSTYLGPDATYGKAIALGQSATGAYQAYVTGYTNSSSGNYPTTAGAFQSAPLNTAQTAFVTLLNAGATGLVYSTYLGGSDADAGYAIATDRAGDAFITGTTDSWNFPVTAGAFQTSEGGGSLQFNAFVTELKPAGNGEVYSTYLGGGGGTGDAGTGIAVDGSGAAYVTGTTWSTNFPTTAGAFQTTENFGSPAAFVTRLQPNGSALSYSSYLGGSNVNDATGIGLDPFGNAYVAGYTNSTNFPTANSTFQTNNAGGYDAFVSKVVGTLPPVITNATPNSSGLIPEITTSQNLTLVGTAARSATVTLYRADLTGALGTTTADPTTGAWSFNYSATTLPYGTYVFTATATVSSSTSPPSRPFPVTVASGAGPVITVIAPATTTSLMPQVIVQANEPGGLPDGTVVTLLVDINQNGTYSASATGILIGGYTLITSPLLGGIGTYNMKATATDPAGNVGISPVVAVQVVAVTNPWTMTAQVVNADPLTGDAELFMGDAQVEHPLDLDTSPDGGDAAADPALVYNSDAVSVQPIVQATIQASGTVAPPSTLSAVLTWNGTAGATYTFSLAAVNAQKGDALTIAIQEPTVVATTGAYPWSLTVVVNYPTPIIVTQSGTAYVVTQDASPLGAGWSLGSLDQLVPISGSGVMFVYGTGLARFWAGTSTFTAPAGDNGALTLSGGVYTYTTPDNEQIKFNSSGYETSWTAGDGLSAITYTYNGSNQLSTLTAADGTVATFTYSGGLLQTIQTSGSRTTTLAQLTTTMSSLPLLTAVTDPDGRTTSYTYATGGELTSELEGDVGNGWAYSAPGILSQTTWGNSTSPSVYGLSPVATQGLTSVVRNTVWAELTDPALGPPATYTYGTLSAFDSQGRVLRQIATDGGITLDGRNGNGYVTALTDPMGRTTTYAYDGVGALTQLTNPDGTTETYHYQSGAYHLLTQATDEDGHVTSYAYDALGHQTTVTDALGETTTSTYYSGTGLLQSVTDPLNHTTSYAYDAQRRLTTVTDALNDITTYTYDGSGNLQTTVDALGHTATVLSDAQGRPTATLDALGNQTSYTYNVTGQLDNSTDPLGRSSAPLFDGAGRNLVVDNTIAGGSQAQAENATTLDLLGRTAATRDADGNWTQYGDDPAGRTTLVTDANGGLSKTVYDLDGEQISTTDPLGRTTTYTYDLRGRVIAVTDPLGDSTTTAYDGVGNVTAVTDALNHTTTYLFDALNRTTVTVDALGDRTTVTFDADGNNSTTTDALGHTTSYAYDALNRQTAVTEAVGTAVQRTTSTAYDAVGDVTATTDALNHTTTYAYDAANRQTLTIDALGNRTTTLYDAAGNATLSIDPRGNPATQIYDGQNRALQTLDGNGNASGQLLDPVGNLVGTFNGLFQLTVNSFDLLNRQTASTDPTGALSLTGYDPASNPIAQTDPNGNVTTERVDKLDRVTATINALNQTATTVYDAVGNVLATVDALGRRTSYAYDAIYRQTAVTDALGDVTTTLYDALGDTTATVDALGDRTTLAYDALNRLTATTNALGQTTQTVYDLNDNVLATVDALGNRTSMAYDALNRQTTTTDALGDVTTTAYDGNGNRTLTIDARGDRTTYLYDAGNRQTATIDALGDVTTGVFDAANQQAQTVDARGNVTSSLYDAAGRSIGTQLPTGAVVATGYDRAGNATQAVDARGYTATTAYDALNRATRTVNAVGAVSSVAYDAVGNQTLTIDALGNRTTYAYDALNRLTQTTDALGDISTVAYDALGDQTLTVDALGRRTTVAYDALQRVTKTTDALGNYTTTAFDADGNVTATTTARGYSSTTQYDALNRVTAATDAAGDVTTTLYDPAGNVTETIDGRGYGTTYAYDALNRQTLILDALGDRTTTLYDAAGNTLATIDPRGFRTTYSYDAVNQQTQVTAPTGATALAYDLAGNETAATDARGNVTSYAYNAVNEATLTINALGGLTSTLYDADGNQTVSIDTLGHRTTTAYDALNRATQTTNALGGIATTLYDAVGNQTVSVDQLGRRTTMAYDALNRVTQTTNALGGTNTTVFDADGNTSVTVDPLGYRTTYSYDPLDRQTAVTDPTGATTATAFDRDGDVTATTDSRGYTTTTLYDALDRQTAVVDALNDVTTTLYDPDGNVTTTITPRGYRTTYAFDQQNRQTALTDALNHTTTTLYDAAGNQTAVIDALGDATTYTYDKLNRQATALTPTGGLSSTLYDAAGDATAQVDALGHTSTSAYDALNRATLTTDSDGNVTATAYDAVGNKTLVTDPDGNVTTFTYDALNRETQETDPRGHTLTYAYDQDSRLTSTTDRLGRVINTSYDQDGRTTGATWITSGTTVNIQTFTYDADGNTLTAADFSGAYTYTYDPLDRVTVAQEPFGLTLTYTFDRDGNKTQMQDSQGGVTTYIYDALDRLSSEQFAGSSQAPVRVDQAYNARGQLLAVKRYSNLAGTTEVGETDYTYDAAGRATNLLYLNGGAATLANNTYTYDAADRQTTEVDSGATLTYTYDNAGQVIGDGTSSYGYDANGNRDTGGNTVGADNLLTNDGTWTYTYDNENNLIGKSMGPSGTTWVYSYNQRDQMVSAFEYSSVGGTLQLAITYTYDVYNRLLAESRYAGMSPVVTRYGYDGANIIVILNAYNALTTRYIRQDTTDALAAKEVNGTTVSWMLTDTEGTVKDLTDNSGAIIDTLTYSAFGVVTLETSPAYGDWLKYTGKSLDPDTGLQYNDNRWYNPTTGRWQTEDPTGLDAGDTNLDRYAGNGPTDATDPSGDYLITNNHADAAYWVDKLTAAGIKPHARMFTDGRWWLEVPASYAAKAKDVTHIGDAWWDARMQEAITSSTIHVTVGQTDLSWNDGRKLSDADQEEIFRVRRKQIIEDDFKAKFEADQRSQKAALAKQLLQLFQIYRIIKKSDSKDKTIVDRDWHDFVAFLPQLQQVSGTSPVVPSDTLSKYLSLAAQLQQLSGTSQVVPVGNPDRYNGPVMSAVTPAQQERYERRKAEQQKKQKEWEDQIQERAFRARTQMMVAPDRAVDEFAIHQAEIIDWREDRERRFQMSLSQQLISDLSLQLLLEVAGLGLGEVLGIAGEAGLESPTELPGGALDTPPPELFSPPTNIPKTGQLAYGSTDLSKAAQSYRVAEGLTNSGKNIAVIEYRAADRSLKTVIKSSEFTQGHAERLAAKELEALGVKPEQVTRIYSELQPCVIPTEGAGCATFLQKTFPQAEVSWSFEYGATKASREAGVNALKQAASGLGK